jgi:short-subunit dehydrogenase
MKILAGKKALITGAASGIGRAIALALAREGVDLFLVDVDDRQLADVAAEARRCNVRAVAASCDLTSSAEISATVRRLLAMWGHLDILVNNAGICYYGATERMTEHQWDSVLGVNLLAPVQLVRELLPTLLAREESHIVNVCSILGLVATRKLAAYQTSKFGLVGLSESLRADYRRRGLGVTCLCPGFVRTNLLRTHIKDYTHGSIVNRWLSTSPERVAARVVQAIRKNRLMVVITPLAHVMWMAKRLLPANLSFPRRRRPHHAGTPVILPAPPVERRTAA